jgi:hypothetical protein
LNLQRSSFTDHRTAGLCGDVDVLDAQNEAHAAEMATATRAATEMAALAAGLVIELINRAQRNRGCDARIAKYLDSVSPSTAR